MPKKRQEKIWCKHISWKKGILTGLAWRFELYGSSMHTVPRNWLVCPICLTHRPTKNNLAELKLMFAMDNDQ